MTIVTAEGLEKKGGASLQPPSFAGEGPQSVAAPEGTDVSISVDLAPNSGVPTEICWRRGEHELVLGDRHRVLQQNNSVLLNVQRITREEAGSYTLTARNVAGEARRTVELRVEDAGPDVPVFLRRLSDLAVKVGTRTRFLVEIRSSSDVKVTWYHDDGSVVEGDRFHLLHEGNFFCVDVAPVTVEDGGRWTCMAEAPSGRASCSSYLNVLVPKAYKAPEFLEELQALLTEQGTVSLECKVVGVPTPVLHWYKDGKEIKAGDVFALTANPDDPTSLGTYTCEAVNCMGKAYSSSRVHVMGKGSREGSLKPADNLSPAGPPPIFRQELKNEKIKIGETITLSCQVAVPPWPQSITWYNKAGRVEEAERYHIMADGLGGYMMEIRHAEAVDEGEWKCMATSNEGVRGISKCNVSMSYPKNYRKPRFLESLKAILTDEGLVSFECKVVGFPTPVLRWFKDGQELKPGDVYQLTGTNSLGSYSCIAKNCMGEATSCAELTVEDIQNQLNEEERLQMFTGNQPPQFIQGLKSQEARISEQFRFTVQVSISPEPSVSWYRDDEQVEDTDRYVTCRETLGYCHLDIRALEIIDQAEWKCVATNEFGHSVTSCFLKLIVPRHYKKPRFLECLRAILSDEGAVNLECKVIGVPQPVLKWYKDGAELKPGDIHRIISGQDGTCCLGTYTCEAHNCMGTVASSASLLGFEDRLMKAPKVAAEQQQLARNPSLSTIHEERTSQMYDTPATEKSERGEISFSFDGKEVSVSLYETPDLTEEEALQVVEMYADQLSEHVSEHNVVELPPLRFVKESSKSGPLQMEAVVVDVTHDAFASAAEEDLRTDADLEEFSITDDAGQAAPPLPLDDEPLVPHREAPKPPPRKRPESSDTFHSLSPVKAKDSDTFFSISPPKGARSPEEEKSEHFTDAAAHSLELDSLSKIESYSTARGSSGTREEARAFQIAAIEEQTKSSPAELVRNIDVETKKRKAPPPPPEEVHEEEMGKPAVEQLQRSGSLKKKIRSVESGLGRSFDESDKEKPPERPSRRGSRGTKERSIESGQGVSFEESGDERTSSEASSSAPRLERRKKKMSTEDVGYVEAHMKRITDQQEKEEVKTAKPGEIKRSIKERRQMSTTEVQTEGTMRKRKETRRTVSLEEGPSEKSPKQRISASSVDLPTLHAAADRSSASEKGEASVVESLTRSLQDIQKALASVEEQVKLRSEAEPSSAKSSLSVLEALSQPIQDSLAKVEERKTSATVEEMPTNILEKISQPIQEFQKGLALVEQQIVVEMGEESLLEKTSMSILENVAQPMQELQRDIAILERQHSQQEAAREIPKEPIEPAMQTIAQSIKMLQHGIEILAQQNVLENKGDQKLRESEATILETLSHPLHELRRGLEEVESKITEELNEESKTVKIGQSLLEAVAEPLQELQRGIETVEQQTVMEAETFEGVELTRDSALKAIAVPVEELQKTLANIGKEFVIETAPPKHLPGVFPVLESLQNSVNELQHGVKSLANLNILKEKAQTSVHEASKLHTVVSLMQPLEELQKSLTNLEVAEFKANAEHLQGLETKPSLQSLAKPLSTFQKQLAKVEKQLSQGSSEKLASESSKVSTVQSLLQPVKALQSRIKVIQEQAELQTGKENLETLEILTDPLQEFSQTLVHIEQEAVLEMASKLTPEDKSSATAKVLKQTVQDLQQAIVTIEKQNVLVGKEETGVETVSKLADLAQPLSELQQGIVEAIENVAVQKTEELASGIVQSHALESVAIPLEKLEKQLIATEQKLEFQLQRAAIIKIPSTETVKSLISPIHDLRKEIKELKHSIAEESTSQKGLEVLEKLTQPIQKLQMAVTTVAPKESSILVLDNMAQTVEALERGVAAIAKQTLVEAKHDPQKAMLTKLSTLSAPLKELHKELHLVEQKIQFESEEELSTEVNSISALRALAHPFQELQRGLIQVEQNALEPDVKPLSQRAAEILVDPILQLQRGIRLVQQQTCLETETMVPESKGFTILENLEQPLSQLQKELSAVEEHNVTILEEAPIFKKAASLTALEKVTQSIHDLQRNIATIEKRIVLEAGTSAPEKPEVVALKEISKPLVELERRLTQVEERIFEPGEKVLPEKAEIATLEKLTKPIQELTKNLEQVEQHLILEPSQAFVPTALQALARPIRALQNNIALIQSQASMESCEDLGEEPSLLKTLAEPLRHLNKGLAVVEEHVVIEPLEPLVEKYPVLQSLSHSVEGIYKGIAMIEKQAIYAGEEPMSEKTALSILETMAKPLKELQKNLARVEHQVLLEALEQPKVESSGLSLLGTLAQPVRELQKGIALIEQQAILEPSAQPMTEVTALSMVKTLAQPIQDIRQGIAMIQEQVVLEAREEPLSQKTQFSVLKTLAKPMRELQKCIALIEQHAVMEPTAEPLSQKIDVSRLQTLAQPLKELHRNLVQIEQQVTLEAGEKSISVMGGVSVLGTIAKPVHELVKGIASIQNQVALEAQAQDISEREAVSMLKQIANPLQELQRGLAQIEQQVMLEAPQEPLSQQTEISILKTLAHPIKEIQKSIVTIEQQAVYEPVAEPMSELSNVSALKTLAQPLQELHKNLLQIEQQVLMEAKEEALPEAGISVLKTLAQPIREVQRSIALIQQQAVLEAREEEMSDRTAISMLQTLAHPIQELQKGIAQVEQQVALEVREEDMSEKAGVSILKALAKPIQEVNREIALIQENLVLEPVLEPISDRTTASMLQTLAQPVQELLRGIAAVQQEPAFEQFGEEMSEKENISVLKTLAQPIQELKKGLVRIEQVVFETGAEKTYKESVSTLEALAKPIQELQRGIAVIEKQALLEAGVTAAEHVDFNLLKTLAKPLQELQRGLIMIEQQELLEAIAEPLSDDTNFSDLPTMASTTDASGDFGVVGVEEQRPLEGELEPLSDKSDPRALASVAVARQVSHYGRAVTQQELALQVEHYGELRASDAGKMSAMTVTQESKRESAVIHEHNILQEQSMEQQNKQLIKGDKNKSEEEVKEQRQQQSKKLKEQKEIREEVEKTKKQEEEKEQEIKLSKQEIEKKKPGEEDISKKIEREEEEEDKRKEEKNKIEDEDKQKKEIDVKKKTEEQEKTKQEEEKNKREAQEKTKESDIKKKTEMEIMKKKTEEEQKNKLEDAEKKKNEEEKIKEKEIKDREDVTKKKEAKIIKEKEEEQKILGDEKNREGQKKEKIEEQQRIKKEPEMKKMQEEGKEEEQKQKLETEKKGEQKVKKVAEEEKKIQAEEIRKEDTAGKKKAEEIETKKLEQEDKKKREEEEKEKEVESKKSEVEEKRKKEEEEKKTIEEVKRNKEVEMKSQKEVDKKQKRNEKEKLEVEKKKNEEEKKKKEEERKKAETEEKRKIKEEEEKKKEEQKLKMKEEKLEIEKKKSEKEKKRKEEERKDAEPAEKLKKVEEEKRKNEEEMKRKEVEMKKTEEEKQELELKKQQEEKEEKELELKKQKDEEEQKKKELEVKKQKDEEEKKKKELELKKQKDEEEKKKKELEVKKQKDEEEKKKKELELEKQKDEEEKKKKELELKKQKDEEEKKKKELEVKKQKDEEEKKKKELEVKKQKEEEEKKKKELEVKKQKEEEEIKELQLKKQKDEEEKKKKELELKKQKDEEEKKKKELEVKKQKEEEEKKELELKKQKDEEEKKKKELEVKKQKDEEEKKKKELELKKQKDEEEKKKKELEVKKQKEEEKKKELELKKQKEEEEKKELELKKQRDEEEKNKKELELKKQKDEEEKKKKELEVKKQKDEEEKNKKELELKKQKDEEEKKKKELEVKKQKDEEEKKKKELEVKKQKEEEKKKELELKKQKDEEEKKKKELEVKKQKDEEEKKKKELEVKKQKEEEKKKELELKKQKEEEEKKELELKKQKDEEEKKKKELELKKQKDEEEKKKKELEVKKQKVEEEKKKKELELKKQKDEEEKKKKELEVKKQKEEEEKKELELKKLKEEEEKRELELKKQKDEEEKKKKELELKKQKDEEEKKKKELELKKQKDEEEKKKKELELKKQKDEEEKKKKELELKKQKDEEEKNKKELELKKQKDEEEKKKKELELKKQKEEEKKKKQQEQEKLELEKKQKQEAEEKRKKEEEENKKREEEQAKKKEEEEKTWKELEMKKTEEEKKRVEEEKKKGEEEEKNKMATKKKEDERKKQEIKEKKKVVEQKKKKNDEDKRKIKESELKREPLGQEKKTEEEISNKQKGEVEYEKIEEKEIQYKKKKKEEANLRVKEADMKSKTVEDTKTENILDQLQPKQDLEVTSTKRHLEQAERRTKSSEEDTVRRLRTADTAETTKRSQSFDKRPWTEKEEQAHRRIYDDSADSDITWSASTTTSSTLTPTKGLVSMEEVPTDTFTSTRRMLIREKVESGPRDARKKPVFASRLTDRTAAQGSRIKLTCAVVGTPDPTVSWLRDGLPLDTGSPRYKTRLEDGLASLEVLSAAPSDTGEYTCVARNLHGETSSSASLKVFGGFEPAPSPPTFTRSIKEMYRYGDDELTLECRVRSHPPARVTWLKNGAGLPADSRYTQSELGDGVCRLVISQPDPHTDNAQYTCRAENAVWSDQISTTVQFAGRDQYATTRRTRASMARSAARDARRPHFSNVLTDHQVPAGGTIALQVEVKGAPKLDVSWMKGEETVQISGPRMRAFEESGVYTLVMADATEKEAGVYTCRVRNAFGQIDTTASVQIVSLSGVRGGKPAMFLSRPDPDLSITVGEDITVSFRVSGAPKPKVTWMKGLRDITNSQRSLKETLDDYVRLTLKRALLTDAGTYCILAKNVYGCDRAFVTVTIRQRARSLTPSLDWGCCSTVDILRDIRDDMEIARIKDVPGPVGGEPVVVDSGRNWLTLSWPKGEQKGGAPVLAYRVEAWILGGEGGARWVEMGVSPINAFDAFNLKPGCEYKFRVTPKNRYGWGESVTTSDAISVGRRVELPEFIKILPGQLKVLRGSTITLECQVRGDPVPEVRWFRDSSQVSSSLTQFDGTTCRLVLNDLQEEHSGRYMCEATNKVGRVSTFARLFVVNDPKILEADSKLKRGILEDGELDTDFPPQFTMRLRDRRVQMTYPVRLTCQVAGRPSPEITWSKEGEEIKQDDRHTFWSEDHFHTLELSRASLEDSGCYSVTARNPHGAVSCRCYLVVDKGIRAYVAPEFIFELEPEYTVREGGELRLFAQVEAYPTVGVLWHRDGVRLRPSRSVVMTLDHDGTVELALAGVTARDAGVYTCTATNEVGRAETTTHVFVHTLDTTSTSHPPQVLGPEIPYSKVPLFLTKPRSTDAVEGDTVIILCEVVGDPKPEVMWLRDWLKPDYYRDAPHFRRVGEGPEYRLEIPRAKLDFTGAYSVIARNCHGEAKAVISLQIYAKGQGKEDGMERSSVKHGRVETLPVIRGELKDLRCCDGDAVTLECRVHAIPPPEIRWEKGGRLVPLGGDFSTEFDGETARLHIQQVYPEDEGEYSCVAHNDLGRAITSACLIVDVPEEKEALLSRQLSRPAGLLSAGSTPRSTPRTTPSRSKSPSISRFRETSPDTGVGRPTRRLKVSAPKFYAVPHNRVAEEGETVRFQCAIAGHPTPWVTWDKDGLLVTPSARLTLSERDDLRVLEITEVTTEDAGFYRVTLENEVGRVEASARLEVIGRYGSRSRGVRAWSASPRTSPTFGRRLIGSAARIGNRITLACDLRGSPAPGTTWYRDGELVVRSSRVTPSWDGRTARLDLEDLQAEDAGVYTCVAENELGRTRCSARLVVLDEDDPSDEDRRPPVFIQGLARNTMATDGGAAELQVRLQGTPPLDVVWMKDGVEIPDCEDFRYLDHGDGRFSLRLADVFPQDGGEYRCEAYNLYGDDVTIGQLTVTECCSIGGEQPVQFDKRLCPVLAAPGASASFCARLQRRKGLKFCWLLAGQSVPVESPRFKVEETGDESILHISALEPEDSGLVTCLAVNSEQQVEASCSTELSVLPISPCDGEPAVMDGIPATLVRGPADTTAHRGDTLVLRAAYVGDPPPFIRWLRAGRELSSGGRVSIATEDGESCLTIEHITADDSGKYVVSVENNLGADCHFASVAVEGPPDPPAGRPTVSENSSTSVNVAWSSAPYDGGCMVTGYRVEMRRHEENEWQVVTDRCHSLSHVVRNLTPGETYVFRVRAENVHGLSDASSESEPYRIGPEEEAVIPPAFEPRLVEIVPGEQFRSGYDVQEELGKGRYGVVHKVRERRTAETFAAKFVRCIKAKDREKVREEIDIMNMLHHPKLLQLAAAFESPREVVMVMEYISGGELFERVVADDFTLTERDCILFMRQICEGVDYMHQNYVVHLDLKPENIMCHTRTSHQIKLIDFGLAQKLDPNKPVRVLFGTPEFIPPEIINYEPIGVESDMWSVGVICYVLLSGLSPFMGDNDAETFANITRADYDFDDEAFDAISQDAKDFISALLVKRKEKRLTAKECLEHTWLAQHDENMSCVRLCTDKLKKFIIRRKWQKTGNAIRALGRMATLSAASRRNSNASSTSGSPRPSLSGIGSCSSSVSRMSSLNEEDQISLLPETSFPPNVNTNIPQQLNGFGKECGSSETKSNRMRICSERSDSGISDCSSIATPTPQTNCQCPTQLLLSKKFSITEEATTESGNENSNNAPVHTVSKVPGKVGFLTEQKDIVGNVKVRTQQLISDLSGGKTSPPNVDKPNSNLSNSTSSSPAKCKKTDSLKQQSSIDSGVSEDLVRTGSPPSGRREQPKDGRGCNKVGITTGFVQARSKVLSAAMAQKETKPKSSTYKGASPSHHPPPIPTSNEHSTSYQKAMAFWKR